ncbi:MAG: head-tail adaptor protein [Pseudomonadota bacterium]
MNVPKLNRILVLETPERVSDGAGGFDETWVAQGELWADVRLRTGRETSGEGGALSSNSYRITVRSAPFGAPSRPFAGQRFRDGTRIFNIHALGEQDGDGRFLTCFAEEEMAA